MYGIKEFFPTHTVVTYNMLTEKNVKDGIKILDKSKVNKLYGGNLSRTDTNHPVRIF